MRTTLLTLACLFFGSAIAHFDNFDHVLNGTVPLSQVHLDQMYQQFQQEFKDPQIRYFLSKQNTTDTRKAIFEETVKDIIQHNANPSNKWQKGVNAFSDMTNEEFMTYYNIVKKDQVCTVAPEETEEMKLKALSLPANWDWRDFGVVTPVKNQGKCGSCWTFSTVGVIESHFMMKYGVFRNMSEQQLVDCSQAFDTYGCNGGLPSHSYEYITYNGGLAAESSYPYMGVDQPCAYKPEMKSVGVIGGSVNISVSEPAMQQALFENGPISVSFTVTDGFRGYKTGVYINATCPNGPLEVNHDVVAVGYGTTHDLIDYWIVKNSWGQSWGDNGFFKIQRGTNMCGISNCGSYPQQIVDLETTAQKKRKVDKEQLIQ